MSNIEKTKQRHQVKQKKQRKKRPPFLLLFILLIQFALIGLAFFIKNQADTVILANTDKIIDERTFKQSKIDVYGANNDLIGSLQYGQAINTELEKFAEIAIDAQISSEDGRFYMHEGTDYLRFIQDGVKYVMAKVRKTNVTSGGASTITSQLVRMQITERQAGKSVNGEQANPYDKVIEQMIANGIEREYTKNQILEYYMNNVPLSPVTYGTAATAKRFFQKDADKLNIQEALYISMTASKPSIYDPGYIGDNPDRINVASNHFKTMAQVMLKQKYINDFELAALQEFNIQGGFNFASENVNMSKAKVAYFTVIQNELVERYGIQFHQNKSNNSSINQYDIKTGYDEAIQEKVYQEFEANINNVSYDMSYAMIENGTGIIKGLYGGRNFTSYGQFVNAVDSERSPGSTTKPLIPYATFLEKGKLGSQSLVPDRKITYTGTNIVINNYDMKTTEKEIPMRTAIETSRNTSAVGTYRINEKNNHKEDMDKIYDTTGFKDDGAEVTKTYEGTPLGNQVKISAVNLAGGYSAFMNKGDYIKPHTILEVKTPQGEKIEPLEGKEIIKTSIFSPQTAYILADIGRTTVTRGTAAQTQMSQLPFWNGGKTGTTQSSVEGLPTSAARDLWYAGYTSNYTYTIWSGYDLTNKTQYVSDNDRNVQYKILSNILKATTTGSEIEPPMADGVKGVPNVNVSFSEAKNEEISSPTPEETTNKQPTDSQEKPKEPTIKPTPKPVVVPTIKPIPTPVVKPN